MELYQKNNNIYTWLYFYLHNTNGSFFVEYNLLPPNFLLHTSAGGVFVGWKIKGYPGTQKTREYFNDIIARFLIAYKEYKPERLDYTPNVSKNEIKNNKIYELKDFQNLPSLNINIKRKIWTTEQVKTPDQIFWAIKIYTEGLIKEFGEGLPIPYQMIEEYTFRNFYDRKDRGTLRAKCRNVWFWYDNRNWTIPARKKEWKMTRSERARKNAELKKQRARAILLGFIQDNLLKHEYIKKDGSWNITKLSQILKLDKKTIRKHLKELKAEGII